MGRHAQWNTDKTMNLTIDAQIHFSPPEIIIPPSDKILWRIRWDDEMNAYDFRSRTAALSWTGYPQTPAVFRFAPKREDFRWNATEHMWKTGDYRIDISSLEVFTRNLLYNEPSKWAYWTDDQTAQFNFTGWPRMAYITMSGNLVEEIEHTENFVKFKTLTLATVQDGMIYDKNKTEIHRFSLVAWRHGMTTHSIFTPKGIIDYPFISKEGYGWMPKQYLIR